MMPLFSPVPPSSNKLDSSERKMHGHPRSHGLTHNLILKGVQQGILLLFKTASNLRLQAFYGAER